MSVPTRGVITVAFGADRYMKMATALADSVRLNWAGTPITLVTDRTTSKYVSGFDSIVEVDASLGMTLVQKLNIDRYTPYEQTLFLDSDCLVVRNMTFVWNIFDGQPFGVVGSEMNEGTWFGADVRVVRQILGIESPFPKFNGGLMYWDSRLGGEKTFGLARQLLASYSSLGFKEFRPGLPEADEPIIAMAMAKLGLSAVLDDGTMMATPIGLHGRIHMDVMNRYCTFMKHGTVVTPAAPHFCGPYSRGPLYRREVFKLRILSSGVPLRGLLSRLVHLVTLPAILMESSSTWSLARKVRAALVFVRGRMDKS